MHNWLCAFVSKKNPFVYATIATSFALDVKLPHTQFQATLTSLLLNNVTNLHPDCISKFVVEGTWCSGITSAPHAEGPGFNPQCVHCESCIQTKWYQFVKPLIDCVCLFAQTCACTVCLSARASVYMCACVRIYANSSTCTGLLPHLPIHMMHIHYT